MNEENKPGAGDDKMQALLDQRMAHYKTVVKYIAAVAALYILFMVWYMMHQ